MNPGHLDIEQQLDRLPDDVADALEAWRRYTLEREKVEALLYAQFRGQDTKLMATEIKAKINADDLRYQAVLNEIKAESNYVRLYERLLSMKRRAALRTAF